MIRTIVTPLNTDLRLLIPQDYVGKQLEILLYTTDEVKEEEVTKGNTRKLRGALELSDDQYKDFQQHAKNIRNEWKRNIL